MSTSTSRVIDFQLPLPWLISGAATVGLFMLTLGWQAAGQSNKLDTLIAANQKLEKRLDDRDVRLDTLRDSIFALQRASDINALKIAALEAKGK